MFKRFPKTMAAVVVSLLCAGSVARADSFLTDDELKQLPADTKESCLVAGMIISNGMGKIQGLKMATPAKEIAARGLGGSLLVTGDSFAFVNVPKGPFRVSNISYSLVVSKDLFGKAVIEEREFDNLGLARGMSGRKYQGGTARGNVPTEMSGTCDGGFIWFGVYKGDAGGTGDAPELKVGKAKVDEGNALRQLKKRLEGTAWAAEIDSPKENKPLKKGQVLEGKVDVAAAQKSVAAIAGQTHNASALPSDEGAMAAAAGVYALETVNGKPLPYFYEANKCTMKDSTVEIKVDGSYATTATIECAGVNYPFPTSGNVGIVGGAVTYAAKVGPAVPATTVTTLAGDTLTQLSPPDTYVYKKK